MIAGKKYSPRTRTSRRPTPETFEHLRRWVTPIEHNIVMTSVEEITNINQQIEQISRFYISSIIQRAIAQLVAQYDDGFLSLKCTADGYLIVQTDRETKTQTSAVINFAGAGDSQIVAGIAGSQICVTGLMFTVGGETNITLYAGAAAISGPMDFGGADEPRGMVDNKGFLQYKLPVGEAFIINSSAAVQVSGYVTGYID
ncbi:hypothetical protein ES707_09538 [subsurface metagenome]